MHVFRIKLNDGTIETQNQNTEASHNHDNFVTVHKIDEKTENK